MRSGAITIFLCGDVMTGRGVDQILPHPSEPRDVRRLCTGLCRHGREDERPDQTACGLGPQGLRETMNSLKRAGIGIAGAGLDLAAAVQPAAIETACAGRVLVFAFATADSGVPDDWAATAIECGISLLSDLSDTAVDHLAAQVSALKRPGDIAGFPHTGEGTGATLSRAGSALSLTASSIVAPWI